MKCKFCDKRISEKTSVIFYMGRRIKKVEETPFVTICYNCFDRLIDTIDEIADKEE